MEGFILLQRKLLDSWIWKKQNYFQWFVYLLIKANFKDNNNYLFEGNFITVKRGSLITSYRKLASELPYCSEQKARTFLKLLEKTETIQKKSLRNATQITILNYDSYQTKQHTSNTRATHEQQQ